MLAINKTQAGSTTQQLQKLKLPLKFPAATAALASQGHWMVDSHKPDPADLGDDEKAECWAPEGMKGAGGGPWGGHMTRGRQWLKPFCAPTPTSGSGPALEGFGDFLPPPTRQTDVERSPVLRAPDTTAGCFSPADGTRDHRQNSYTSLTKELGPVRCGFKPTLCVCSEKLSLFSWVPVPK